MSAGRSASVRITRAQRKVLDFISVNPQSSSRQIAESVSLSRRTVQAALCLLCDLRLIDTVPGCPTRASRHKLLPPALGVLGGGAI